MGRRTLNLREVDEAQITLVMDNSVDLLMASTEVARRFSRGPNPFDRPQPIAEHGFSALIRVRQGSKGATVLLDAGVSRKGILHNLDALEINGADIQAIILSHGHPDHTLGLPGLIDRIGPRQIPLVLHPDAYLERKLIPPKGTETNIPSLRKKDLRRNHLDIIEETGPSVLADGMVLVSGEVARTTDFEKGFSIHYANRHGIWEPDPLILDDQCAIMDVRGKGLIIVTGCGHAGIINTIRYAQNLTGVDKVYAVVGGFHLTGGLFEPIIPATTAALQEINPRYVMPGHCTGWSATHQIARAMPEAFIPNSVGTTLIL